MIKKASELVQKNNIRIRILIAGFPGIGKTTVGLSAPKPLHIDTDYGVTRVNPRHRTDTIQPNNYQELLDDLKPENLKDYETLVFDTGGALFDLMKPYLIKQDAKNGKKNGDLSLQGYGAAGREFKRLMDIAYYQLRKHVVIIFHAKEEKDGENTRLRILVEGKTKNDVWQPMDLGGFMEMQGNERTIGFTNCERYFAKGTHGIQGIWRIKELQQEDKNDFLTKLFEKVQKNIEKETEVFEKEREAYEALMASFDFEHTEINTLMEQIINTEHILTSKSELRAKIRQKAKKEGYVFDTETKKYVLIAEQNKQETKENELENNTAEAQTEQNENKQTENKQTESKKEESEQKEKFEQKTEPNKEVKKDVSDNGELAEQLEVSTRE